MQGFNNYGNNNGYGNNNRNNYGMNNNYNTQGGHYNNYTNYQNDYRQNGYNQNNQNPQNNQGNYTQETYYQNLADDRIFVAGRIGADVYQLPHGVNKQILWDDFEDRFYVKGYDENGRPRVLADNDFQPHVEKNMQQADIDMSQYATKDDIKSMIADAYKKIKMPNMNGYVTTEVLDKVLSELSVGAGGKVIRDSEQ